MGKWAVVCHYAAVGICGRLGCIVYVCCISMLPFEETRIYWCTRVEWCWSGVCEAGALHTCFYGAPEVQNTTTVDRTQ